MRRACAFEYLLPTHASYRPARLILRRRWGETMRDDDRPWDALSRRSVITGAGASAIALSAGTAAAQRQVIATGTVFEDRSGAGSRRAGDPGIAGVMVSNGRDVTTTASDGRWRLPIMPGDSL